MNKWLALYAVLCIATIIGYCQLGWQYETAGYGFHPLAAMVCVILLGFSYFLLARLTNKAKRYPNRLAYFIDRARKDPRYLEQELGLCIVLEKQCAEGKITRDDLYAAKRVISNSIEGFLFLSSYLKANKVIDVNLPMSTPAFRKAANAHWDKLIAELNQGDN